MRELSWKSSENKIAIRIEMNKAEAASIIKNELAQYRKLPYEELVRKIGEQETFEKVSETGEKYQIEVDFFFDDEGEKTLRVAGMISYSFWTDFSPVCSDFIIAPDGKFIDE